MIHHLTETSVKAKKASVSQCCRVLGLSRSGFYAARQRLRQPEQVDPLSVHAKAAFEASGRSYGSRRLSAALRAKGLNVGRYRARQLMRGNALQTRWRRKFVHTTDIRRRAQRVLVGRRYASARAASNNSIANEPQCPCLARRRHRRRRRPNPYALRLSRRDLG